MKIISMYLPQFHHVKENDEWWGKGYTEWIAVKNADKLYEGHVQPKVPLNKKYYDLMEKSTMEWQAKLMRQYGVNGQCFYHYWFKNGRQILEKPAENLLQWTDIDMPFCFCWANDTWARTWSNIQEKNEWAFRFEKSKKDFDSGILLEQQYGKEDDWKIHYDYLKKFFKDSRYIKYDEKPLFLIYKSRLITCIKDMLACWNKWAIEDGYKGIYVIGANVDINTEKYLDGILYHEPQSIISKQFGKVEDGVMKYQYRQLWDSILVENGYREKTYYGGFVAYDDTPRRGKGGIVIEGASPELFQEYFSQLIAKNFFYGNEYIFLNAWNEWGEGMYLEPDIKDKYSYLEAVKYAREHYREHIEKFKKNMNLSIYNELDVYRKKVFRYEKYWKVLDAWLRLREQGKKLEKYLVKEHIEKIGIYGVGMMGRHLISELSNSEIKIVYAIDQKAEFIESLVEIYRPDEVFPTVDAIIITILSDVEEIIDRINKKIDCKIILLEKMVMDIVEDRLLI